MTPATATKPRRLPTGKSKCYWCKQPLAWARTQNDRPIPLNPDPDDTGRALLVQRPGSDRLQVHVYAAADHDALFAHAADGAPLYRRHDCRGEQHA